MSWRSAEAGSLKLQAGRESAERLKQAPSQYFAVLTDMFVVEQWIL